MPEVLRGPFALDEWRPDVVAECPYRLRSGPNGETTVFSAGDGVNFLT